MDLCAQSKEKTFPYNLLESERKALAELMKNEDIVMHHADKGQTILVQDKAVHIQETERQLTDGDVYTPLNSDPTLKFGDVQDGLKRKEKEKEKVKLVTCYIHSSQHS